MLTNSIYLPVMRPEWPQKLTTALHLKDFEQDWGICNADASRLPEFLDFYESNVVEHPWEPEALAELILESTNDAISEGMLQPEVRARVIGFLRAHAKEFPHQRGYWLGLNDSEFPVVGLFREAVA
jgi:hypothetical protein